MNVHKTFRRRPRRILNILCTFNLRPVFTGKSSNWYNHNKTTYGGSKTCDAVTSQFGLKQLIKERTHILGNSFSCTGLMFTSHPSLVMESDVYLIELLKIFFQTTFHIKSLSVATKNHLALTIDSRSLNKKNDAFYMLPS